MWMGDRCHCGNALAEGDMRMIWGLQNDGCQQYVALYNTMWYTEYGIWCTVSYGEYKTYTYQIVKYCVNICHYFNIHKVVHIDINVTKG